MLRYLPYLLVLWPLISTVCFAKENKPCTVYGEDGEYFDLSPLTARWVSSMHTSGLGPISV
jgi:hypothetical protein